MDSDAFAVSPLLCAFFSLCLFSTDVNAASMIEDDWLKVQMESDRGDLVTIASDGSRLTSLLVSFGGEKLEINVSFLNDVEGPRPNLARILIDSQDDAGYSPRHLIIPFSAWKGEEIEGLEVALTIYRDRLERVAVLVHGDLNKPIFTFNRSREWSPSTQ